MIKIYKKCLKLLQQQTLPLIPLNILPLTLNITVPCSCHLLKLIWKISVMIVLKYDQNNSECCCQVPSKDRQICENITLCPSPPYLLDLVLCDFYLFPKVKRTMKSKYFQSIQDIKVTPTTR